MGNVCKWVAPMVTLVDGRQVPSTSEEWRAECEARTILGTPHEKRHELLQAIADRRGAEARERLDRMVDELEPSFVLGLPNRDVRKAYAAKVEYFYGQNAREALEHKVLALWNARKVASEAAGSA